MKKLLIITSLFLLSFTTNPKEKKYNFELTDGQVAMLWNTLEFAKQNLQTSQAPANDVKNAIKMIDSIQQVIKVQYIKQTDTNKK
jgi:hypothetical protein